MNKLRKALVISVAAVTVLSMTVVVAPKAQAAVAGDLIKMSGLSSVYFLAGDGKRYVFPNEQTYFSWYSDFSQVVTIPQSELELIPLGKNVTIRPGTKLVKITTDPKVYAVEPNGVLKHVADEAGAKTLWGDNWAKRVVDVPDAFFTNYTVGAGTVTSSAYPAGSLIKMAAGPEVYYIAADGKARKIASEAAFLGNRFKWDDIITATIALPALGTDIAGAEGTLTDTSSGAGGSAGAGTGLTVSLSTDTPASNSVPSKSTLVPFLVVNLTASNDGDVMVSDLTFTRFGTGAVGDFAGGYLFDGMNRLTTRRSINSSDHTITFNAISLVIPAGKTKAVTLRMDAHATNLVSGNHGFRLTGASMVKTNGAAVSGSFPISGNIMAFSNSAEVGAVELTAAANIGDRKVGETNVILGEFEIKNDNKEVVKIYRIKLRQDGDAGNSAVNNLSLDIDGTIVAQGVSMVDRYVDFVLDTPFELKKSANVGATIRGDVITDITKKVQLYLNVTVDFDARGTAYGDFYSVLVTNTSLDGTSADEYTIKGSEINVSFDGPQAADVKADSQDVVLANLKVLAQQNVNIERLTVTLYSTGASNKPMQNLEMIDSGNNLAFSTADPASGTPKSLEFENIYLRKGVQYSFAIRGDIQDGTNAGAIYSVAIDFTSGFTARFQDANETSVTPLSDLSATSLTGKNMTVAEPSVIISKTGVTNQTAVKGAANALLYKIKITATNVDDLRVSRLQFDGVVGQPAGNFSKDWSKLTLYAEDGNGEFGTRLGASITSLNVTTVAFSGFTLNVPKGLSNGVYVTLRGDAKTQPSATTTEILLNTTKSNHTVRDSKNNALTDAQKDITGATTGHITTVVEEGSYVMAIDKNEIGVNANQNILAGGLRLVGRIKVTAANEAVLLKDLVLQNSGSAQNGTLAQLRLYSDKNLTTLLGTADVAAGANPKALFQGLNGGAGIEIPTTGITYLYVGAILRSIDYSNSPAYDATGAAGGTVIVKIPADDAGTGYVTKAYGKVNGTLLSNGGVDNSGTAMTSTVMGAVISSMTSVFPNGTLADGTRDIFSFKVTAPASANKDYDGTDLGVKLASTTFTIASSSGISISSIKIRRVGGTQEETVSGADEITVAGDKITLNLKTIYANGSNLSDLYVRPGETAEYIIRATVAGVSGGTGKSLQTSIDTVDSDVWYTHNTGTSGSQGTDAALVRPLVSGLSSVIGGTLSN